MLRFGTAHMQICIINECIIASAALWPFEFDIDTVFRSNNLCCILIELCHTNYDQIVVFISGIINTIMTNVEFFKKFYLKILVQFACTALLIQGKFVIKLHSFEHSFIYSSAIAFLLLKFLYDWSGLLNVKSSFLWKFLKEK